MVNKTAPSLVCPCPQHQARAEKADAALREQQQELSQAQADAVCARAEHEAAKQQLDALAARHSTAQQEVEKLQVQLRENQQKLTSLEEQHRAALTALEVGGLAASTAAGGREAELQVQLAEAGKQAKVRCVGGRVWSTTARAAAPREPELS